MMLRAQRDPRFSVRMIMAGTSALMFLIASPTLFAQAGSFEGVITMELHGGGGAPTTAEYMMKGGKLRLEAPGRAGLPVVLLFDPATHVIDVMMTPQRMYMERALDEGNRSGAGERVRAKIEKSGRKETIAGVECEHWTVTENEQRLDVCVAHGLGTFFLGENAFSGRGSPGWSSELKDGAFPLKVVRGDGTIVLQVTHIARKPLEASLFAVPDGFQKMQLPGNLMRKP